ncbi:MAG: V-type proton ATPase subunit E [Candidatus Argoarchaeum ethanivorans]|uniref:V-type proton ATPase subunit E n=1 Tax=Candidatus Argoarchaeum ethanivorans TaxID=2608793 RepID=A0A812A1Q8_9EURY|nr:MAG: V-type proton ATPase subunit E [Candidatus Argoarchaeum ethanivorans]
MGLETVVASIIEKGKEQTKAILQEADKEVTNILKRAESEAEKEREELEDAARVEAEQLKKQEISSVHLKVRREALNARQAMLEEVQKHVADRITSISDEKNAKFLEALLKKHAHRVMQDLCTYNLDTLAVPVPLLLPRPSAAELHSSW